MPKISVIIPAHNEETTIGFAIASVLKQSFQDFEIIVVDDGSTDCTQLVIKRFVKENPEKVRCIAFKQGHSAAFARNKGAKLAKGDILVFFDADCTMEPRALENIALRIYGGYNGVAARTLPAETDTIIGRAVVAQRAGRDETNAEFARVIENERQGVLVANMMRSVFENLGGYDESIFYFEDEDLTRRFFKSGYSAIFDPGVINFHRDPDTFWDTTKQAQSFGKGIASLLMRGEGHVKLLAPLYSILVVLCLIGSFALIWSLVLLIPLLLIFVGVWHKSKDVLGAFVFVILFEYRNLIKMYSIVYNLVN